MTLKNNKIYIFGAHSRSITFGVYMRSLFPETDILAYLYDNDETNPSEVDGVPVISLKKADSLDISCPVYLAVRGTFHERISGVLKDLGFMDIISVTPGMDTVLRNRYVKKSFASSGREFIKIDDLNRGSFSHSLRVYVTRSIFDKPLKDFFYLAGYECFIQAGTDISERRLEGCTVFDNEGDNISGRNKQFCELTALYRLWKGASEDVIGLVHYRRHFVLPKGWEACFEKADVILPVPLFVYPSLKENYVSRHTLKTWNLMMEALAGMHGSMLESARDFFENNGFYSPCNMFIMKREILNDFCEWLFPVLFYVSDRAGELTDAYQNRYPGFLSERLLSFFFYYFRDKYHVVYADKNFLN